MGRLSWFVQKLVPGYFEVKEIAQPCEVPRMVAKVAWHQFEIRGHVSVKRPYAAIVAGLSPRMSFTELSALRNTTFGSCL